MNTFLTLFSALPDGMGAPEWIHICPADTFTGADGRGPFQLADPNGVIKASLEGGKIPVDESHSTDKAAPAGHPAPARGWITQMEARQDGIWAKVEWNAAGRSLLDDKAYRGLSPVFLLEKGTGRIIKILRVSLTNDPNLPLTSLHAKDASAEFLDKLRQALGLKDDADEAAILTEATAAGKAKTAHNAALETIKKAFGLTKADTAEEAVAELQSRGLGGSATLLEQVTTLQSQMSAMQAEQARKDAERVVDEAITAGKVMPPLRDYWIESHLKEPQRTAEAMSKLPSLHDGGLTRRPSGGKDARHGLTEDELNVCSLMGLEPKAFAESKKNLEVAAL
ncbi:phage protease [Microvirga sp. 2MCAF35]|uniref:phage protease n=1 Tax=Microvirga sp. 2MCAF35 TaxID=3232987 RepID=UPI003F95FEF2